MGSLHLGFDENYMNRSVSLLSSRVTPVEPSLGEDDVVEVGVGVDDSGGGAPGAAEVNGARPRDDTSDEREARVLRRKLPLLRGEGSARRRDRVDAALLVKKKKKKKKKFEDMKKNKNKSMIFLFIKAHMYVLCVYVCVCVLFSFSFLWPR